MSTASRYRETDCKARAERRNAASVPGAAKRPPTHHDVGVPQGFPCRGCAPTRNVPLGSGQLGMTQVMPGMRPWLAQILALNNGFPSHSHLKHRRKTATRHSPPLVLSQPP